VTQVRGILVQNFLVSKKYLETIKALDGKVYNLSYHQERLERVQKSLQGVSHSLVSILQPPAKGLYRCRVIYDKENISVEYLPYKKRDVKSLKIVYNDEIEYSQKYLERDLLNELFALRMDCDDIVVVKSGLLRDTPIANIAFFDGKEWITPKRPLLMGTTRERYLREKKIIARDIFVDDLQNFTKVALMNAMIDFDIIAQDNIGEIIC